MQKLTGGSFDFLKILLLTIMIHIYKKVIVSQLFLNIDDTYFVVLE